MRLSQQATTALTIITQYCVEYGKGSGDLIVLGHTEKSLAGLSAQEWFFAMEELAEAGDIKKRYCGHHAADFDWVVA